MKQVQIVKVLRSIRDCTEDFSLGHKRFHYLPRRVQFAMKYAHVVGTGSTNSDEGIRNFLERMSEQEYSDWLKLV